MQLLMSSDLHGRYDDLFAMMHDHEWDVWVDCGDFLPHPNWPGELGPGISEQQEREQANWWRSERLTGTGCGGLFRGPVQPRTDDRCF